MNKNSLPAQEIIKKISSLLANKIEEDNIKGACNRIPFILKYYLHRYHNIAIDIHFGLIEYEGKYAVHNWNSYEGKKIDITIHCQLINELNNELNSDCLILDEIYIRKGNRIVYHDGYRLPKDYLDKIERATYQEYRLKSIVNRSIEEEENLQTWLEILDADSSIISLQKRKMTETKNINTYLKNHFKDEWKDILEYLQSKNI